MPKKKEKPVKVDEPLYAKKAKGEKPVKEFKTKLNKYSFIHVPKKAVPTLPFEVGEPLKARIEEEKSVVRKA